MKLLLTEENTSIIKNKIPNINNIDIDYFSNLEEEVFSEINTNVNVSKDVIDSFISKKELESNFWDENNQIKPEIRLNLIKIAIDFFKELELPEKVKIKDIIFTGSLTNYNWSEFSDVDLHIVFSFKETNLPTDFIEEYLWSKKQLWNLTHDIEIYGYPVEIYAQDLTEKLSTGAVYSLLRNKWISKPNRETYKINKKLIIKKANIFINALKDIKKYYDRGEITLSLSLIDKLKEKINKYRKKGLNNDGEYAIENIVFKVLRRTNFLEILSDLQTSMYDEKYTINENYISLFSENVDFLSKLNFIEDINDDEWKLSAFYENEKIGYITTNVYFDGDYLFDDLSDEELGLFTSDSVFTIESVEISDDYYKGVGLGTLLVKKAIEKAKKDGFTQIFLNASPMGFGGLKLNDLIRWYEKFGFKTIKHQGGNALMLLNI